MHRHPLRAVAAVALALALSACWYQDGGGPANTRFNAAERTLTRDNVASLAEQWRAPVDATITEPILSSDRAYVTTRRYGEGPLLDVLTVRAYDRDTGDLVWERSLLPESGDPVTGGVATPALADGALWVPYWHDALGPCAGALARLDPETGEVLGTDATTAELSAIVVAGSTVAYTQGGCGAGVQLVVRDRATREVRWTYRFPEGASVVTPTIADGRLALLTARTLYAFDADGCGTTECAPLWTRRGVGTDFDFLRLAAGPGDALVTVGAPGGPGTYATIVVRDGATGDVRWQAEQRYTGGLPGAITGFAVAYDTVYVAGGQSDDVAGERAVLDAYPVAGCGQGTCAPAWTVDLGPTRPAHAPTVAGGVVYVSVVSTYSVAPAVVAADAGGCGSPACDELVRVPLVDGSGVFLANRAPYVTSVGAGRAVVGWSPGLYGSTLTEIISLGSGAG